jgi:gamma-glutamyltranspeptidase/glutathione hydrolase
MPVHYQNEHTEVDHFTGRPVIRGRNGIVSTGHYLTSMAAIRQLLSGGNAFDAAVAACMAAAVVEPTASYSLAAEGVGMFYHAASGRLAALSGQGVAPRLASLEAFRSRGLEKIPTGPGPQAHLSFTVPGVVDACFRLLENYGSKTLVEVLAPAVDYAEHGFPMYEYMHRMLDSPDTRVQFDLYPPGGTDVFYPGGLMPAVGARFVQPQLAATLRLLVQAEAQAVGSRHDGLRAARAVFYEGEIARRIAAFSERCGGLLRYDDLASYQARIERPIETRFAGHSIHTQSTWSQAGVLLQTLNMLGHLDLRALGHNSPAYVHTVTEALKLAFADRERYYGDPDFATVPADGLFDKAYAARRLQAIGERACPELPAPGVPSGASVASPTPQPAAAGLPEASAEGTTHLAVIDGDGNMVCMTPSGGVFRKSAFAPELGCTLSTRSEMFFLDPNHPNRLQPGKRPRTTLVNYIVCKDARPVMTFGCPGGDDQTQANLQLMLNVLVFGMDPQQAVEAPRFSTQSMPNSFYPRVYHPGVLNLETGFPDATAAALAAMGHRINRVGACGIGAVITQRDADTGILAAGADPRRPTYAMAW